MDGCKRPRHPHRGVIRCLGGGLAKKRGVYLVIARGLDIYVAVSEVRNKYKADVNNHENIILKGV